MLEQHMYVAEKLSEAEAARRHAETAPEVRRPIHSARGPIGPIARAAGRHVRRVGEALESWATPQAATR